MISIVYATVLLSERDGKGRLRDIENAKVSLKVEVDLRDLDWL